MFAVVVRVKINDFERAQQTLKSEVVPGVSAAPGFKAGYWMLPADGAKTNGLSVVIFDSEDNARAVAARIPNIAPADVNVENVEVREVVASA